MKLPAGSVLCLLPFLLTGCFHKTQQTQVQALAPSVNAAPSAAPKPEPAAVELPPSAATIPSQPITADANSKPRQAAKPPVKRQKSTSKNTEQAANTAPQAGNESPGVSAIGQLSSGDPSDQSDQRRETVDSIAATERGLNGIGRALSDSEQKTAAQIREFLKQAREALNTGDVDGAHTLAAKAKVLLRELSQ
jgi:hypothetical protein